MVTNHQCSDQKYNFQEVITNKSGSQGFGFFFQDDYLLRGCLPFICSIFLAKSSEDSNIVATPIEYRVWHVSDKK